MNFKIEQRLTTYNRTEKTSREIKYIVIHYFGSLGTAKAVAEYFYSAYRAASAHYIVDEGETVYQCVLDKDVAWHCGDNGKGTMKSLVTNSNSIGIEVRPYILDTSQYTNAAYAGWYFTDAVADRLTEVVTWLMEKYGIDVDHVVRHYDVTAKWCPRPWMGDDLNLYYGTTGNEQWQKFKARLSGETGGSGEVDFLDDLDKFKELWAQLRAELRDNDKSAWSEEARAWAVSSGLVIGGGTLPTGEANFMWEDLLTREQAVMLMYRFAQLMGKA